MEYKMCDGSFMIFLSQEEPSRIVTWSNVARENPVSKKRRSSALKAESSQHV